MSNGYTELADPNLNLSRRIAVGDFGPREPASVSKAASPQTKYASAGGYRIGEELGRSGLRHWGGFVFEEWLRELQQGRRAAEVYRDMMDSDAIIGSIMYLIQTLIRRVSWRVEPGDSSRAAQQGADWYWEVLNDMRWSWTDTVGEVICFLGYGYSYFEEVYKYRRGDSRDRVRASKFNDNTIGLAKLGLRAQDALWKWVFDDNSEIEGLIQNPPPDYLLRYVPMEKAMLFRTTIFKNNPEGRSVLRSAYRCFSPDTELLTERGWTPVADVTLTDRLATLNDMGVMEYHEPTELHAYDYAGEMVHVSGRYVDQMVTPNHNLYVKPQNAPDGYRLVEAQHCKPTHRFKAAAEWLAPDMDEYEIPAWVDGNGKIWPKRLVAMDDWVRFLGIYLAEGHAHRSKSQGLIGVSQKIGEGADTVREWVEAIGFPVYAHSDRRDKVTFEITRGQVYDHLAPLGKALDKHIPAYLKSLSRRQLRIFLDAYHFGDGTTIGGTRRIIYTASKRMADDLMELALKAGYSSRVTKQAANGFELKSGEPRRGVWIVSLGRVSVNGHRGTKWERVPYDGQVYCVTVPNHTVLARRNGMASWSGNSWYMAKNFQNLEGIGIERDAAGLPVLKPPMEIDLWNPNDPATAPLQAMAQNMISSIRRDEQEGVILPFGWELELLTTGGRRQFDIGAIITRYETRMAMTILADVVMLGQNATGSYALAVTKKDMLAMSLGGHLDIIASQHNSDQIPRLWRLNGFTWPMPKLVHGTVESIDLDTLGNYLMRLAQGGAPIDWTNTLEWAMQMAGAPAPSPGHDFTPRTPMQETVSDRGPSRGPLANSSPISKAEDFQRFREFAWEGS